VSATRPILRVGLTGGIASGKTTVAGFLAELGAFVVDADAVAHEVADAGGTAHAALRERFGDDAFDAAGRLRRAELAARVFADPDAMAALNAIVHPRVLAEVERRIERQRAAGHAPVAVVEAALLVETGAHARFDRLVVARCGRETQLWRLVARSGLSPDQALARIATQLPLEAKLAQAHYVIDTDTTLRETRLATAAVWTALLADFERLYGPPGTRTEAPS
jgi:dephospho-CoA kinase